VVIRSGMVRQSARKRVNRNMASRIALNLFGATPTLRRRILPSGVVRPAMRRSLIRLGR